MSERYGFFKNKSRAGITGDFVPYPTFPDMPNATVYYNFANNSTKTGNVSLVNANASTLVNLDSANIQPLALPTTTGNVLFTDLKSQSFYNYDYVTENITAQTWTRSGFPSFSNTALNGLVTQTWAKNGDIHIFNGTTDGIMSNLFLEANVSTSTISCYLSTSFSNVHHAPRGDIRTVVPINEGNVLLMRQKSLQSGGEPVLPYQIWNTTTKTCSNAFINYGNASFDSNLTDNSTRAVLSPSNGNVYILPGQACFANSFINPTNVDFNQKVIVEVDFTNSVVAEYIPSNASIKAALAYTDNDRFDPAYSSVSVGADGLVYMFPGKLPTGTPLTTRNNIISFDPTNVDATLTMGDLSAWDSANISLHSSRYASLGIDGHITANVTHRVLATSVETSYLLSIDTNPTSATYRTGYLVSASGFNKLSKNFTWCGNGNLLGGPIASDSGSGFPIKVIQVSGVGSFKTQYATWNRYTKNSYIDGFM